MPSSWTQLYFHIVFGTKQRTPWLTHDWCDRLYPFIGGIVRDQGCSLIEIGGMEDHLHLLVRTRADVTVSDLLRHIKARSSRWMHETSPELAAFSWQEGYGAFSVSKSALPEVQRYIVHQPEHHRHRDFAQEFVALLRAHGIEDTPEWATRGDGD